MKGAAGQSKGGVTQGERYIDRSIDKQADG